MSTLADKTSLADSLMRAVAFAAGALLVVAAALVMVTGMKPPVIERLQVRGDLQRVNPEQVLAQIQPFVGADLLHLDLGRLQRDIEGLPWIASAQVTRVWPDTLRVHVREHHPIARWGSTALLSSDGTVIRPPAPDDLDGLPVLSGPSGQEAQVLEHFRLLLELLEGSPWVPAQLQVNERGAWTAHTASGIELRLGRGEPAGEAHLLLGAVTEALGPQLSRVAYVDLRYSNGFAVGWRQEVAAQVSFVTEDGAAEGAAGGILR